jgi:hypothetical protein
MELKLLARHIPKQNQVVIERNTHGHQWNETILTFKQFAAIYGHVLANRLQIDGSLLLFVSITISE